MSSRSLKAQYDGDGFAQVRGLLSVEETDIIRAELDRLTARAGEYPGIILEKDGKTLRSLSNPQRDSEVFTRLIRHPRLLSAVTRRDAGGFDHQVYGRIENVAFDEFLRTPAAVDFVGMDHEDVAGLDPEDAGSDGQPDGASSDQADRVGVVKVRIAVAEQNLPAKDLPPEDHAVIFQYPASHGGGSLNEE